jgi:hypothetical protein
MFCIRTQKIYFMLYFAIFPIHSLSVCETFSRSLFLYSPFLPFQIVVGADQNVLFSPTAMCLPIENHTKADRKPFSLLFVRQCKWKQQHICTKNIPLSLAHTQHWPSAAIILGKN